MFTSSDAYGAAVLKGGPHIPRAVIRLGDTIVEDTYYTKAAVTLVRDDSEVSFDRGSDSRGACSLTFNAVNYALANVFMDTLAYPEVELYDGIYVNGAIEWIPLGVYGLTDIDTKRTGKQLVYECNGVDRSERIRNNPWRNPYQVTSGTDYFAAMKNIVTDRAKGFTPEFNLGASALTVPAALVYTADDDPWEAVLKLAEAVACEAYFDDRGVFAAFPVVDPFTTAPTLQLVQGQSGVLVTPLKRSSSNQDVYSGVICRGEAPWLLFPVSGEVWDEDPLSPSYRYGTFGEKPLVIRDAVASTDAQCLATATAEFKKIKGQVESIDFNLLKDPRQRVGDVVDIYDPVLDITGRYTLEKYKFPLGNSNATGLIRRKR